MASTRNRRLNAINTTAARALRGIFVRDVSMVRLGETAQVSAFLGALARAGALRSVLIVAPATVLSHWRTEVRNGVRHEEWLPEQ